MGRLDEKNGDLNAARLRPVAPGTAAERRDSASRALLRQKEGRLTAHGRPSHGVQIEIEKSGESRCQDFARGRS